MRTFVAVLAVLLLAACAVPSLGGPTVDQILASPAGQADPLAALKQAGYPPDSEIYQAAADVLREGISPANPQFARDVDQQIASFEMSKQTGIMVN